MTPSEQFNQPLIRRGGTPPGGVHFTPLGLVFHFSCPGAYFFTFWPPEPTFWLLSPETLLFEFSRLLGLSWLSWVFTTFGTLTLTFRGGSKTRGLGPPPGGVLQMGSEGPPTLQLGTFNDVEGRPQSIPNNWNDFGCCVITDFMQWSKVSWQMTTPKCVVNVVMMHRHASSSVHDLNNMLTRSRVLIIMCMSKRTLSGSCECDPRRHASAIDWTTSNLFSAEAQKRYVRYIMWQSM